jgi:hypothetical protein
MIREILIDGCRIAAGIGATLVTLSLLWGHFIA